MYTSYQIFNDKLSIGSQFLTIVFNFLISYPFYTIARNFSNYVEIIIFLREMKFKEKEDNRDIEEIILPQKIQLNNICFGYDENVILKNIFLNIDPLIVIEIFGKSGCGKKDFSKNSNAKTKLLIVENCYSTELIQNILIQFCLIACLDIYHFVVILKEYQ